MAEQIYTFLKKYEVGNGEHYNYVNMDTDQKYRMYGSVENSFLDYWEIPLKTGNFLPPLKKYPKGKSINREITCFIDVDGYKDSIELKSIKTEFIGICKKFFDIPSTSKVTIFTHQNTVHDNKCHLYLLLDGSPITVKFSILKRMWESFSFESDGSKRNCIDKTVSDLRLPGALKANDPMGVKGVYPYKKGWRKLLIYNDNNKVIKINSEVWAKFICDTYTKIEEKLSSKQETQKESKNIQLTESQKQIMATDEFKEFFLEAITKSCITIGYGEILCLYHFFVDVWNLDIDELVDFVSKTKDKIGGVSGEKCSGQCVLRIEKRIIKSQKFMETEEAYFRLRKKIKNENPDLLKHCPVYSTEGIEYNGVYFTTSYVLQQLIKEGDKGAAELYLKIRGNDLILTDPDGSGKGIIAYIWEDETKLWEELNGKSFVVDIMGILPGLANKIISYCETMKDTADSNLMESSSREGVKNDDPEIMELSIECKKWKRFLELSCKRRDDFVNYGPVNRIVSVISGRRKYISKDFLNKVNTTQYLLPLKGKNVIDFTSGKGVIRERTKDDLFSETISCEEIGDPNHEDVKRFMESFQPDEETRNVLKRLVGEAILGLISEKTTINIMYGPASNGKSTFIKIVKSVFTSLYSNTGDVDFLLDIRGKNRDKRRDYANMFGMRLTTFSELSADTFFDVPTIKKCTGGDDGTGCKLFKNQVDQKNTSRLLIATNDIPNFTDDEAMRIRLNIIPCTTVFASNGKGDFPIDRKFGIKCNTTSLKHFLAYFIEGANEYLANDFDAKKSKLMIEAYESVASNSDPFPHFMKEYCKFSIDLRMPSRSCYAMYSSYMQDQDEQPKSKTTFFQNLKKEYNFIKSSSYKGERYYIGITCNYVSKEDSGFSNKQTFD